MFSLNFIYSHVTLMVSFKANFLLRTIKYYLVLFLISAKNSVQVHSDVTSRHCHCCGSVWQWVAGLSDGGVTSGILGSKACNERKTGNSLSLRVLSLSLPLSLSFSFPFPLFFSLKERDGVKKHYFPTQRVLAHKDIAIAKRDRQTDRKKENE